MTGIKMTLGARILANLEDEKRDSVETARKRAHEAGMLEAFQVGEAFFSRFTTHLENSASAGRFPAPVRMTPPELAAFRAYQWEKGDTGPRKSDTCFALWEAFSSWATAEDIRLEWRYGHDGAGRDSWWNLVPTPHLNQSPNRL